MQPYSGLSSRHSVSPHPRKASILNESFAEMQTVRPESLFVKIPLMPRSLNRRDFLGVLASSPVAAAVPSMLGAATEPPNILYIMADDHALPRDQRLREPHQPDTEHRPHRQGRYALR